MSGHIGAVALRLRARQANRAEAERVAREFRVSLPSAFGESLRPYATSDDVALVPRMRVTLRAPLARISGRELAHRIARACTDAIAAESMKIGPCPTDVTEGTAERTLRVLRVAEAVRVDRATEAASFLIALARDERGVVREASPYADLVARPAGSAFVGVCARSEFPRAVIGALGRTWARVLALRCSPAEALQLLRILDDGSEPDAATWRALLASFATDEEWTALGVQGDFERATPTMKPDLTASIVGMERAYTRDASFAVRVLVAALDGIIDRQVGIVAAARSVVSSDSRRHELLAGGKAAEALPPGTEPGCGVERHASAGSTGEAQTPGALESRGTTESRSDAGSGILPTENAATSRPDATAPHADTAETSSLRSECTGFWLLLPHLTAHIGEIEDLEARALAFALAEYLCGERAASDPAIVAFMSGERPEALRDLVPPGERIDRLAVKVVRAFAQSLMGFERARCNYILRAFLRGPGEMRRTKCGWIATLPRSPLRIVLERDAFCGEVVTPWSDRFELVREL